MPIQIESQAEPIPGYRLIDRLGSGGFGEVWKAEAPGGLLKAIKFVHGNLDTNDAEVARAEQELKSLMRVKELRHPYILSLERLDIVQGQLVIVTELADCNLWDRFREARREGPAGIPREELLRYLFESAEALDYMNSKYDLQHLDIKPQNLFLVSGHVKVADFGLVKDLEGLAASVTGGVTPYYAAPETFEGWVSRYSDQYSLAIVYQELLTGQRPFQAANPRQLIMLHLNGNPSLGPLPPGDRGIVSKALAKRPEDRHATCLEFVNALRKAEKKTSRVSRKELSEKLDVILTPAPLAAQDSPLAEMPTVQSGEEGILSAVLESDAYITSEEQTPNRTEETGAGESAPTLVIGVGRIGGEALCELRYRLVSRYGSMSRLPHMRMLFIDTDESTIQAATDGADEELLSHDEAILAKLRRPSHYLRPKDPLPVVEDWVDSSIVYRISRNYETGGIRALGRLAFIDHYRPIMQRVRTHLEHLIKPETLAEAEHLLGGPLRTNWPQVFIVSSLTGGTGSGMVVDVAFALRQLLQQMGYERQDVHGVFLLPGVDEKTDNTLAVANAHAALLELANYSDEKATFSARYYSKAPVQTMQGPPCTRHIFIELPGEKDETAFLDSIGDTAEYVLREAMMRFDSVAESGTDPVTRLQTIGLQRIESPQNEQIKSAAVLVLREIITSWTKAPESDEAESIQKEMLAAIEKHKLDAPQLMGCFQSIAEQKLGGKLESNLDDWVAPFRKYKSGELPEPGLIDEFVKQYEAVLGSATETAASWSPPKLPTALIKAMEQIQERSWAALTELVNHLINQPGKRLGGAELGVKHLNSLFEGWLKPLEAQVEQLESALREGKERIEFARTECIVKTGGKLNAKQRAQLAAGLPDLLRRFGILRYQHLIAETMTKLYFSMRGRASDLVRDLGFYSQRIAQLMQVISQMEGGISETEKLSDLRDSWDMARLEEELQARIQQDFQGLLPVLTSSGKEVLHRFRDAMLQCLQTGLESRLDPDDGARIFLNDHGDKTKDQLTELFRAAHPRLKLRDVPLNLVEQCWIRVPDSEAGQQLLKLAAEIHPKSLPLTSSERNEILILHRQSNFRWQDLPQLGDRAKEAYDVVQGQANLSAHARMDTKEWTLPG